jgi:hypothetical protein
MNCSFALFKFKEKVFSRPFRFQDNYQEKA